MYVYFIKTDATPVMIKIGKARNPDDRMATLQTGCPYELKLIGTILCKSDMHAEACEKRLHREFKLERRRGEWFCYSDAMARIVATIIGRPFDETALSRPQMSNQKNGSLNRKQRWAEYERHRALQAVGAMKALDEEFRNVVRA
jgi:hypothetical protein